MIATVQRDSSRLQASALAILELSSLLQLIKLPLTTTEATVTLKLSLMIIDLTQGID